MQNNTEKILEDLIIKAKELGISFKNGPATYETIYDNKIFHVLEEMSDDVFIDLLSKKIEQFESKKFLTVLQRHSLVDSDNTISDSVIQSSDLIKDKSSSPLIKQD